MFSLNHCGTLVKNSAYEEKLLCFDSEWLKTKPGVYCKCFRKLKHAQKYAIDLVLRWLLKMTPTLIAQVLWDRMTSNFWEKWAATWSCKKVLSGQSVPLWEWGLSQGQLCGGRKHGTTQAVSVYTGYSYKCVLCSEGIYSEQRWTCLELIQMKGSWM